MKVYVGRHLFGPLFALSAGLLCLSPASALGQDKEPKPVQDAKDAPDKALKPTFGSVKLVAGFENDPFKKELVAGGKLRTNLGGVDAWIDKAPDFTLDYTTDDKKPPFPLTFFVESGSDSTLLINLPDGAWKADDDSGGNLNPLIKFEKPQSGRYSIWVGTYSKDTAIARLHITEFPFKPRTDAPKRDTWTAISVVQLEQMLKDKLKISTRRVSGNELEWDYGKEVISVITYSKGKALVISATLKKEATLEKVNDWNDQRIFSRAILKSSQPRLEADLDCEPGVNWETIRSFINRFSSNLDSFKEFIAK